MNKKILNFAWLFLLIILIIASFLRIHNITQVPTGLYPDEAINGNNALEALRTGNFKVFYPENNGREGLFMNIQAVFLKFLMPLFNNQAEPWMLRLPSVIFGILTVLGIYFLAKELFRRPSVALLSSFFLATSFWHVNFSRIAFRAIMAPFFLVWGIYFLLKSFDAKRSAPYAVISGIFYGLGFYSYIAFRATPLLILIIFLLYCFKNKEKPVRKKILVSFLWFLVFAFIIALPLGLHFLNNPQDFFGRTSQISVFSSSNPLKDVGLNFLKTAGMFNFMGDWNWRHNIAGRPELFWPVGVLFILGVLVMLCQLFSTGTGRLRPPAGRSSLDSQQADFPVQVREDQAQPASETFRTKTAGRALKSTIIIIFSWLVITALPVVISNEGLPHALRAILMAPAVFMLAGFGGVWLYEKLFTRKKFTKPQKVIINISLFIVLSLFILEAYSSYFVKWANNSNTFYAFNADYAVIASQLNSLPKETPKYVVVEAPGIEVDGIPMPAQSVMFFTDTFTLEKQKEKNIFYLLPDQTGQIPQNSHTVELK